jgi:C4-dicarboxylate-specific signal transduction histidine kinase
MRDRARLNWSKLAAGSSYAVSIFGVAAAVTAGLLLQGYVQTTPIGWLFICAIIVGSWFGGVGPGLVATALSVLAFDYFFLTPLYSFGFLLEDLPRIILFAATGCFVVGLINAQRNAVVSLRRSRAELQEKVRDLEKLNAALQKSEQRYRNLFHHMPIALWQLNASKLVELFKELRAQGVMELRPYIHQHPYVLQQLMDAVKIEEVNERMIALLGARDANEILGLARFRNMDPDAFLRGLESRWCGEPMHQLETKITTLDGRVIDVLFAATRPGLLTDPDISLVGLIDITERVRAQEMLQRVQGDFAHAARVSMLGELTASIAHEVNQPLAAIVTNGEVGLRLLNRYEPDLAELRELTEHVVDDARRAAEVIARVRAMATRKAPEQALLPVDEAIREALLFLRHQVQSHGVMVTHYPDPAVPKVLADRMQLQQVIVNLAVNAIQAMAHPESPQRMLCIRTVLSDPRTLCCTFEDSGSGIKPEHLDHLFDSFFTTKDSGMGLGLAISRSIIEAHGGQLQADNGSALGGARFSFTLPAKLG